MRRRLSKACLIAAAVAGTIALSGCQTIGDYYDSLFGSKEKAAKLVNFVPTATVKVLWDESVGDSKPFIFSPALDDGIVYAASAKGNVTAFSETGRELWRNDTKRQLSGGVSAADGFVLVGTNKGEVLALNAQGQVRWIAQLSTEVLAPPQYANGFVIARSGDGRIYGLDANDGTRKWVYQRSTPALTVRSFAGVIVAGGAVFAGFPGGKLVAVNVQNGVLGWEGTVAQPRGATELERVADITSVPVVDGRQVCAVAFQGRLTCFDGARGTPLWARDISAIGGLAISGSSIFVTDDRGAVIALDKNSGSSLWKQDKLADRRVTGPLVYGEYIIVGDFEGYVHVLHKDDGSFAARIATDKSGIATKPIALERGILVQTRKGGLYAIDVQ